MDFETKKILEKYNPKVNDYVLKTFLNQMRQIDPHFDMEEYFKKSKQLMEDFKRKYPNADMSQFLEETYGGINDIYFKSSGFKVFGDDISNDISKNIPNYIKQYLGKPSCFPKSLILTREKYPILTKKPGFSLESMIESEFDIYV